MVCMKRRSRKRERPQLPYLLFGAALVFLVVVIAEEVLLATTERKLSTAPTPVELDISRDSRTCSSRNGALVTIVLSARPHRKRRDAIRETWGQNHSVFFVVGESEDPAVLDSTYYDDEIQKHGDLILTRALDNYQSLPMKLKFAMKWLDQRCDDGVSWVLKLDDDMFARIGAIARLVRDYSDPSSPVVLGNVLKDEVVKRFGKWIESSYQNPVYPLFAQGSCGYIVSRPIVSYIAEQLKNNSSLALRDYQGEDTSLGIWLDEQSKLDIEWWDSPQFVNHGNCEDTDALSIGHKMTPELMRRCFAINDNIDPVPTAPVRVDKLEKVTRSKEYMAALQRHEGYLLADERNTLKDQRKLERERRRKILAGGG